MENGGELIKKMVRFFGVGIIAAVVNITAMYLLAAQFQMIYAVQRNLANFLAMLAGVTVAFMLNRHWTWDESAKKAGKGLLYQFFLYCASAGAGAFLRVLLFVALDFLTPIHYLVNVAIGIGAAALLDFFLYNKYVFCDHERQSAGSYQEGE